MLYSNNALYYKDFRGIGLLGSDSIFTIIRMATSEVILGVGKFASSFHLEKWSRF